MPIKKGGFPVNIKFREKYLHAFLICAAVCVVCFLPIMLLNHGRFFYYGDFNKQQLAFYTHLHQAVRNGTLSAWDTFADLGSDTVASYSFYLLGSPFFWLMTVFPTAWVPTLIPLFLALKSGTAAIGAYGYIRCFCKNQNAALIGAVLFGLSSFNSANILFNHFHDAVLMLPFMLWALEKLVRENKRGFFGLSVAFASMINYYFFFGQALFIIIYFFAALFTGHFKVTPKIFFLIAFEAAAGVMMSALLLLPSAMSVMNNPRIGNTLNGSGLFVYSAPSTYLFILKNMLLLPDITLLNNFGMTTAQSSGSFASYIPFFSLCGVIAYFRTAGRKDFFRILLTVCGVMMLVPALNQSFSLFNSMFYGRWFYMPLLIACAATARSAEEGVLKKGFLPTAVITAAAAAISLTVTLLAKNGAVNLNFDSFTYAYIQPVFTLAALFYLWTTLYRPSGEQDAVIKQLLSRTTAFCAAGMCAVVWCSYLFLGTSESDKMNSVFDLREENISFGDGSFFRFSGEANLQNMPVIWGYPTVRYFSSTVEPSITGFYNALGLERTVKSDYEPTYYPLMELLSVRYYADEAYFDSEGNALPPSEYLTGTNNNYKLLFQKSSINFYENTDFLPMGFCFDKYTTAEALAEQPDLIKSYACLEAVLLTDEQIKKYSDILTEYDPAGAASSPSRYKENVSALKASACGSFEFDGSSFRAHALLDKDSLMFFSVPYSEGWSAEINGSPAEIDEVFGGLMAVRCPAGSCDIVFTYKNRYFTYGLIISAAGAALMTAYLLIWRRTARKARNKIPSDKEQ